MEQQIVYEIPADELRTLLTATARTAAAKARREERTRLTADAAQGITRLTADQAIAQHRQQAADVEEAAWEAFLAPIKAYA
jgi:hypothetical protein